MRSAALVLLLLLLAAPAAEALDVIEVRWGFDGRAVPDRINAVSVLLSNPRNTPYEGVLALQKSDGFGTPIGARIVEPCYLSPLAQRWVQFYVPVEEPEETWTLAWGGASHERVTLPVARLGAPARVLLDDSGRRGTGSGPIPRFPDELFPTDVVGLDGLDSVLLDHAPRWEPLRRQVFMDWLRNGGVVHVFEGDDGRFPVFADELSVLNSGTERASVGAGLMVRHEMPRNRVTESSLASQGFPPLELKSSTLASYSSFEDAIFQGLEDLSKPEHNWALIYGLAACYIALVGPLGWVFGRLWKDWRRTLLIYLGVVALFGTTFFVIGRRDVAEGATVYTLSYARPLAGGNWDVTQWSNAFVTSSGRHVIRHAIPHGLYAVWKRRETMSGTIRNGRDAAFEVDIPLYSGRTFTHRGRFKADPLDLAVAAWDGSGDLTDFALIGTVPNGTLAAWACYHGKFYPLAVEANRLALPSGQGGTWPLTAPEQTRVQIAFRSGSPAASPEAEASANTVEKVFNAKLPWLMLWAMGWPEGAFHYWDRPARREKIQVFILAPSPESFNLPKGSMGRERGYTAYHLTFFKGEK